MKKSNFKTPVKDGAFSGSASELATTALKIRMADLPPSQMTGPCGLCGVWLTKGESVAAPYRPSVDFGAADHLSPSRAAIICQACVAVVATGNGLLTRHSRALFTPTGAYRMSSAEDVGWMLTQAAAPFVAVFNTKSSAHIVWQTPVTHDRAVIYVSLGQHVGTIRPHAVMSARLALERMAVFANEIMESHYQWPVMNLSLYDDVVDVCRLIPTHERVLRQSEAHDIGEALSLFDDINLAERWALSALLLARPKRDQAVDNFKRPPVVEKA